MAKTSTTNYKTAKTGITNFHHHEVELNHEDWERRLAAVEAGCATTLKQRTRALKDKNLQVRDAALRAEVALVNRRRPLV